MLCLASDETWEDQVETNFSQHYYSPDIIDVVRTLPIGNNKGTKMGKISSDQFHKLKEGDKVILRSEPLEAIVEIVKFVGDTAVMATVDEVIFQRDKRCKWVGQRVRVRMDRISLPEIEYVD